MCLKWFRKAFKKNCFKGLHLLIFIFNFKFQKALKCSIQPLSINFQLQNFNFKSKTTLNFRKILKKPVSYTHLTLPTILRV